MDQRIAMNPNRLVQYLQKPAAEFTRADIIRYCEENQIEFVNFHYCGWDGRLKTLNFVIHSLEHLENILTAGERVDGSSLFPFIEAGKSDLYVVPKYRTAFRNPHPGHSLLVLQPRRRAFRKLTRAHPPQGPRSL